MTVILALVTLQTAMDQLGSTALQASGSGILPPTSRLGGRMPDFEALSVAKLVASLLQLMTAYRVVTTALSLSPWLLPFL